MKAIVYRPGAGVELALEDVAEPVATDGEAVVSVEAFSLNFADVAFLKGRFEPGQTVGFEACGTVLTAAADGTGPRVGARVVGFAGKGGWAQRRLIAAKELVSVPAGLEAGAAAALPVAGVTALRALRALGTVLGRRVLVTGASGGVGRMAVQLAARAGAHVIAVVGDEKRGAGLKDLGAAEMVTRLDALDPVDAVLENVGGTMLTRAYERLLPGGTLISIGMASLEPSTIDFEQARLRGGGSIQAFNVFSGGSLTSDLPVVLTWAAEKQIDPQIGWRGPWTDIATAVTELRQRRVKGKAVCDVTA